MAWFFLFCTLLSVALIESNDYSDSRSSLSLHQTFFMSFIHSAFLLCSFCSFILHYFFFSLCFRMSVWHSVFSANSFEEFFSRYFEMSFFFCFCFVLDPSPISFETHSFANNFWFLSSYNVSLVGSYLFFLSFHYNVYLCIFPYLNLYFSKCFLHLSLLPHLTSSIWISIPVYWGIIILSLTRFAPAKISLFISFMLSVWIF